MEGANQDTFLFDGFRLDRRGGGLSRRNENGVFAPVPIGQRAADVLGVLVARAGEVVSRDEIIAAVWPHTVVEDNNLNMQIAALRRALDGGRTASSCIQTIPRHGYRFIEPVIPTERPTPTPAHPLQPAEPGHVDRPPGPEPRTRGWPRRAVMAGVVGTLMLTAIAATAWNVRSRWFPGVSPPPRMSIVVLPFANLAGDPRQQYFADGITEDLTTDLSRLPDMLVISRDTAFTYKDRPASARRIGRELSVRYVLEGSVQRSGNQVRVNAQLIDAGTDTHLWAQRFDRDLGDLLALQNDITERIALALNLKLVASESARPPDHPDALDHIFRGRAAMYRPASRRNLAEAVAEYQQALTLDPSSVEAQGRLAVTLATRVLDDMSDSADADIERANQLIEQALASAPESPLAHFAKAQLLRARHHCEAAIPEYEFVLAADRNSLPSIGNIGRCEIYLGLIDDGVALEERAIRVSPHDPFRGVWYFRIGQARLLQSHVDEAIQWLEKARNENSAYAFIPAWLAAAYGLKGDSPRAAAELSEARKLSGNGSPVGIVAARGRGAREFTAPSTRALLEATYLAGLRKAGVPEE